MMTYAILYPWRMLPDLVRLLHRQSNPLISCFSSGDEQVPYLYHGTLLFMSELIGFLIDSIMCIICIIAIVFMASQ